MQAQPHAGSVRSALADPTAWVRWLAASLTLTWLAAAWWPRQIDDFFITATYAREWSRAGQIRWPTGELVEGYSNFLWLAWLRVLIDAGVDVPFVAKLASLVCGVALLAVASARLPRDGRGHLVLFALSVFTPLGYWSAMGMETTLFVLLTSLGWWLVHEGGLRWAAATWLLAAAALVRPEGAAWLALALVAGHRTRGRALWIALGALAALALYHARRAHHFGAFWPTPVLDKLGPGLRGAEQLAVELVCAGGVLASAALVARPRGVRDACWMLAPLGGSAALLVLVNGDWMGHGRILLSGLVASAVAWVIGGQPRVLRRRVLMGGALLAFLLGTLEPRFLERPAWRLPVSAPWSEVARGLDTPMKEQVAWLVARAPWGATVQAADVGILSHIPGLRILDSRGLCSRKFADSRRNGDWRWLEALYSSAKRPSVIQVASHVAPGEVDPGPPRGLDPWIPGLDPVLHREYPYESGVRSRSGGWLMHTRFHRAELREPTLSEQRTRWRELARRFPSQPWFQARLVASMAARVAP